MEVVYRTEHSDIATVYIGDFGADRYAEFVESVQPPLKIEKKWVLIVSTLFGCPVGCRMCDAGKFYRGKLSADEIFSQIDYPVLLRFPQRKITVDKFKIQFARMGEPALNPAVLEVLKNFCERYEAPGFIPSISTIAPKGSDRFLDDLIGIKNEIYNNGKFQIQFSIHSTSDKERDNLIPVKKWDLNKISRFGDRYFCRGDKKITLNFIFSGEMEISEKVLNETFDPEKFIIKITPVNPTINAVKNGLNTDLLKVRKMIKKKADELIKAGFDVIVSIGELEENRIGSNCGQYIGSFLDRNNIILPADSYTYNIKKIV